MEEGGGGEKGNKRLRTPLFIARVRTQVGHHDRDALPVGAAGSFAAGRRPRGRELVARPAPGAAPRGGGVATREEPRGAGGCVESAFSGLQCVVGG